VGSEVAEVNGLNLPHVIKEGLNARGIKYLTPPQVSALRAGLLNWGNVVVVAPTASGKTLIAEMALINAVLNGGIGVYATPLKALASEKFVEFRFWERFGVRVGISTGDYDEVGESLGRYDVIVTTYERLDSILRHKPSWVARVRTVVVDELHNVGDEERGPVVELICARALTLGKQVVGLSATVGKPEVLARWLGADLVVSDWRPVKLIEGFYDRRRRVIEFNDGRLEGVEGDLIEHCVKKALDEDYQLLIFKQSRRDAEAVALKIAGMVSGLNNANDLLKDLLDILKRESPSRSEVESLTQLLNRGIAYHHAGLSLTARRVIEDGFRGRLIKVVVATPTLAAGINLPARRVLIYTKRFEGGYMRPISVAEYKQMAGRAGRPQYDPFGEAVVADPQSASEGRKYVEGRPEEVTSALLSQRALRIHVLATVASGYARSINDLDTFFSKTLAYNTPKYIMSRHGVRRIIDMLRDMGMIREVNGEYLPTELGDAVTKLYVDPLTAKVILEGLEGFDEVKDIYYLHLIALTPDFNRVRVSGYTKLEDEALSALDSGLIPDISYVKGVDYHDWLRGFKIALILSDWINEVDEDRITWKYNIGPGDLTSIIDTATWLAYAASKVCSVVGLYKHSARLDLLTKRIEVGVKEDVLELTLIKGVGRVRARILMSNGIRSLEDLAKASPSKIAALPTFGEKLAHDVINQAKAILSKGVRGI